MVRDSLAANAKNVNVKAQLKGLRLTYRTGTGGSTTGVGSGDFSSGSVYLRLQRVGNAFNTFSSVDGVTWTAMGSVTLTLGSTVYVGLATSDTARRPPAPPATAATATPTASAARRPPASLPPPRTSTPAQPTATNVALSWTDNANNETGYRVERQTAGGAWAAVATLDANRVSFADTTVTAGTTYNYRVVATSAAGDSAASNVVTVTTPASRAPPKRSDALSGRAADRLPRDRRLLRPEHRRPTRAADRAAVVRRDRRGGRARDPPRAPRCAAGHRHAAARDARRSRRGLSARTRVFQRRRRRPARRPGAAQRFQPRLGSGPARPRRLVSSLASRQPESPVLPELFRHRRPARYASTT